MCNSVANKFHKVVLHGETLVFVTTAILATVAEVESGSTFRVTCLATEVQKVLRNRPCYTVQRLLKHVSQRRCTLVATPLHASCSFSDKDYKSEVPSHNSFNSKILWDVKEPTHLSKRVGHEVPGVVAALFSKVGSEDITCKNADRPEHISLVERACLYSGKYKYK